MSRTGTTKTSKGFAKKLLRIDVLFLLTGLFYFVPGLITYNYALDLNIHDAYFVTQQLHIGILFFLIHAIFALVYFFMHKHQKYILALLHFTSVIVLLTYILLKLFLGISDVPRRYYSNSDFDPNYWQWYSNLDGPVFFYFIIGQVLFLINIVYIVKNRIRSQAGS